MKKLIVLLLVISSCKGTGQVNLDRLTNDQWLEDLHFMVNKINKSFAGFTPDLKSQFQNEAKLLQTTLPGLSKNQKVMEFVRLLALLQDGHTELSLTGPGANFNRFPLILYYFGKDLRIVASDGQYSSILGSKIVKIANHDISEIFEKLKSYMNKDNEIEYTTTAPALMIIPEVLQVIGILSNPGSAVYTLIDDHGKEKEITLTTISSSSYNVLDFVSVFSKAPLYLEHLHDGNWYTYLSESRIMYVHYKTLYNLKENKTIKQLTDEMLQEVDKVKPDKLVLDFRLCRGGNYNHILPLIDELKNRSYLNTKGKLFVVSGRLTFSAAAVALLYFKQQTQATLVGEVSRARPNWTENMEESDLPNSKLNFDYTDKLKIHFPSLGNSYRIPLDKEITKTFENYKAGIDEVLEYIQSLK